MIRKSIIHAKMWKILCGYFLPHATLHGEILCKWQYGCAFSKFTYSLSCKKLLFYFTNIFYLIKSGNFLFFHTVIKTLKPHVIIKEKGRPNCQPVWPAWALPSSSVSQWWRPSVSKPPLLHETPDNCVYPLGTSDLWKEDNKCIDLTR